MIRTLFFAMVMFSILIALMSFRFLALGLDLSFPDMPDHIAGRKQVLIAHVMAAPIALILGSVNLWERRKKKRPNAHRWTGRGYGLAVLVGGISGLGLAIGAAGGMVATLGFGILSVLWLGVTAQAIRLAMARDFVGHRRWMIRSFALTFAAVTLRLYLPAFFVLGEMTYTQASVWVAWLCWIPNLIFAEWWLSTS